MDLPKTIEFTLEEETYRQAVNGAPEEKFGRDFSGGFRLRWPTRGDRLAIAGRFTAFWQAMGVMDTGGLQTAEYIQSLAMATLEVLTDPAKGGMKPPWCSNDSPSTPKLDAAIVRAYEIASERMRVEKKSSESAGSKPSSSS